MSANITVKIAKTSADEMVDWLHENSIRPVSYILHPCTVGDPPVIPRAPKVFNPRGRISKMRQIRNLRDWEEFPDKLNAWHKASQSWLTRKANENYEVSFCFLTDEDAALFRLRWGTEG